MDAAPTPRHHPAIYATGRYGCWGECACGQWQSRAWTTISGVHLEFGEHLLAVNRPTKEPAHA